MLSTHFHTNWNLFINQFYVCLDQIIFCITITDSASIAIKYLFSVSKIHNMLSYCISERIVLYLDVNTITLIIILRIAQDYLWIWISHGCRSTWWIVVCCQVCIIAWRKLCLCKVNRNLTVKHIFSTFRSKERCWTFN